MCRIIWFALIFFGSVCHRIPVIHHLCSDEDTDIFSLTADLGSFASRFADTFFVEPADAKRQSAATLSPADWVPIPFVKNGTLRYLTFIWYPFHDFISLCTKSQQAYIFTLFLAVFTCSRCCAYTLFVEPTNADHISSRSHTDGRVIWAVTDPCDTFGV